VCVCVCVCVCDGLTDLARRVQPTLAVDATMAPSYSFEGVEGLAHLHPSPFDPSRLAPVSYCNFLLQ